MAQLQLTLEQDPRLIPLLSPFSDIDVPEPAMRREASLIDASSWSEIGTPPTRRTIDVGNELARAVAVEIRKSETVHGDVPAGAEPDEVDERHVGVARACG